MNANTLYKLCTNNKWAEVRDYISSDETVKEKKRNMMLYGFGNAWTCLH